jgi:hypothetical protein
MDITIAATYSLMNTKRMIFDRLSLCETFFDSRAHSRDDRACLGCGDSSKKLYKSAISVGTIRRLLLGVIIYGLGLNKGLS